MEETGGNPVIISIQQPEYFPWLGFFDKLLSVDMVVFLDNVQFKKRYFENRNRIRTPGGWTWITTPVLTKGRYKQRIMEVEIDNSGPWQRKVTSSVIYSYKKAPYWKEGGDELCELINRPYKFLVDFNLAVIFYFMKKLGIEKEYLKASTLGTDGSGSRLIHEICRKTGASHYLSGRDGRNYLDDSQLAADGIAVTYQDFKHPVYDQLHSGFLTGMSIADLYFNHGCRSREIIQGNTTGRETVLAYAGGRSGT